MNPDENLPTDDSSPEQIASMLKDITGMVVDMNIAMSKSNTRTEDFIKNIIAATGKLSEALDKHLSKIQEVEDKYNQMKRLNYVIIAYLVFDFLNKQL